MKGGTPTLPPLQAVKVLDQLRERFRYLHYSRRTEEAHVHWVKRFIRFHGVRDWLAPSTASGIVIGTGEIFGGGVAPVIAGYVAQHYGIQYILHLAAMVVGLVVVLLLKETAPCQAAPFSSPNAGA